MPKCVKCGAELNEGAAFCQQCGTPVSQQPGQKVIEIAGWGDRLIAYIIDIIIVGVIVGILKGLILLPSFFIGGYIWRDMPRFIPWADFGLDNLFQFIYFLWLDLSYGQSVGKMVMKIRVTNLDGGQIDLKQAAIETFGKAFLLPFDLILGWIFYGQKNQRLFTYAAQTIVVKEKGQR